MIRTVMLAWALGYALAAAPACGQAPPPPYSPEVVDLARVCVAETGWDITDECAAIGAVLRGRAERRGVPFRRMARAYARGAFRRDHPRGWLAGLNAAATRPRGWPGAPHPEWSHFAPQWLDRLDQARAILEGIWPHVCRGGDPEHWGARHHPVDRARARRAVRERRWRRLDCGDTGNDFYAVNRR